MRQDTSEQIIKLERYDSLRVMMRNDNLIISITNFEFLQSSFFFPSLLFFLFFFPLKTRQVSSYLSNWLDGERIRLRRL